MTRHRRIYLASSWRNAFQPTILNQLRLAGHTVYDFRHPAPGNIGFSWSEVDPFWQSWTPESFNVNLHTSEVAAAGFSLDKEALEWCDTCILALPCGRSAHLELGYSAGQGKDTYILLHEDKFEPELMYLLNTNCSTSIEQIIEWMDEREPGGLSRWHQENGGHFGRPANHALRMLHEVIELCVATGASAGEILNAFNEERRKAYERNEFGVVQDASTIAEEAADVGILLEVFCNYAGININEEKRNKLDTLWERKWQADPHGVLWRPPVVEG